MVEADLPETSCSRSPVTAPTTASTLPPMRSAAPSTYCFAWAALYSVSPCACSSRPDWDQEVAQTCWAHREEALKGQK